MTNSTTGLKDYNGRVEIATFHTTDDLEVMLPSISALKFSDDVI